MKSLVTNTDKGESGPNFLYYIIILAKHCPMIVTGSAAVAVITFLTLFVSPNIYTATARLLPPQENLTMSAQLIDNLGARVSPGKNITRDGMGGMAASLLGLKSAADMYVSMMTSNPVLDQIIDRFNLIKFYKVKFREDAREKLINDTMIFADKKDSIIRIKVTWKKPVQSAEIANAYIEELDRLLQKLALHEAEGRSVFLEKERLQANQNLSKAEESLRHFSEKNSILQIDTQTRGAIEYIARLRAEIDAKEVGIEVLRQQATPLNYDLVRLETEVKGLKEKLHFAEAKKENCFTDVCLPTEKAPILGLEYLRLFREVKFQEGLYQLYSRLVEIARLDMVRDIAVVQVLEPAHTPERKSNRRLFPSMIAGMIAIVAMIGLAFGKEYFQDLKNREDDTQLKILKKYCVLGIELLIKPNNKST